MGDLLQLGRLAIPSIPLTYDDSRYYVRPIFDKWKLIFYTPSVIKLTEGEDISK